MKNVSAFVVLGAFIISVVLTGCADLDNALSSLKVDQQKDSLTEDIDRAKNESIAAFSASELMTVKKLSYLTDSASRTLRSSEQGDADTIAAAKAHADAVGEEVHKAAESAAAKAQQLSQEADEEIHSAVSALDSKAGDIAQGLKKAIADSDAAIGTNTEFVENTKKWRKERTRALTKVHFASGRTGLNAAAKKALDDIVAEVNAHGDRTVSIAGHADGNPVLSGSYRSNWDLSQARAESVAKYLKQKGVSNTIETLGHGHTRPIGPTNTKAGRDMNRRATVRLLRSENP